jgi:hypothetical protein
LSSLSAENAQRAAMFRRSVEAKPDSGTRVTQTNAVVSFLEINLQDGKNSRDGEPAGRGSPRVAQICAATFSSPIRRASVRTSCF